MLQPSLIAGPKSDPRFKRLASAVRAAEKAEPKTKANVGAKAAVKRAVKAAVRSNVANPGLPARVDVIRAKADAILAKARAIRASLVVLNRVNRAATIARSSRAHLIKVARRRLNRRKRPAASSAG